MRTAESADVPPPAVAVACSAFLALPDPKEPSAFAALIALPLASAADFVTLVTAVSWACAEHDGNRIAAGPSVARHLCGQASMIVSPRTAAEWCNAVRWLCGGPLQTLKDILDGGIVAAFVSGGTVPTLIDCLRRFTGEALVCVFACCALAPIACLSPEHCTTIVSSGGLGAVCAVMLAHASSEVVQGAACEAPKSSGLWHQRPKSARKSWPAAALSC